FWTKQELYDASLKPGNECAARCDKDDTKCRGECASKFPPITTFRDGMYQGIVLEAAKNPYKVNLMPPDFTLHPLRSIRKGQEATDLYRLIASGVGGVMPAWVDGLKPDEIWALTHYVKSLMDLRQSENIDALRKLRDKLSNQPPFVPPTGGKAAKRITVSISEGGEVTIGGQAITQGGLKDHFTKLMEESEVEVSVMAHKSASKEKVTAVIDAIKSAGVTKVALASAEGEGEGEGEGKAPEPQPGGEQPPPPPEGEPKTPAPAPAPAPAPETPPPQ
ncbi:MAG TPA: biopolymer transporter ExbD, partial [Polyangiaceae bacterium]|nr:biopolymer transporter ExbD [Polyangiaceae bacterium]